VLAADYALDRLFSSLARLAPVSAVHRCRIDLEQTVRLHPAPCRLRRHGQVMRLRASQARLDLDVVGRSQETLPVLTAGLNAPSKELPPSRARAGGLEKAQPIAVQRGDPRLN